jgi:alkylation response protein AidB-like acyl-CoA dehydrogenase
MTATPVSAEQLVRGRLGPLLASWHPDVPLQEFRGALYDAGLAWVWFPAGCGGLGVSPDLQAVVDAELQRAGVPVGIDARGIGLGMGGPTIAAHGTEEQKRRYLRPMFSGEEIWCQLFSEPGAGSDLAGLATSAIRDQSEWLVNGQKVWTSVGHLADWGLLLARHDPNVLKHKGLTYFLVDMHSTGIEVRPLREMTGEAAFNEIFFSDVRVPDSQRLGDVGEGWRVALTTLMNERVSLGGAVPQRGEGAIADAMRIWWERGLSDPALRDELMRLWVQAEVNRLTNLRARQLREAGTPGPEGSVAKLAFAELGQRIYSFAVDLLGPEGMLFPANYVFRRPEPTDNPFTGRDVRWLCVRSRAFTIEGGSSEVLRNILGERVLGLPGDVRVDREVPWREVPRSG